MTDEPKIIIEKDGPYVVSGGVPLNKLVMVTEDGNRAYHPGKVFATDEEYTICRCGQTKKAPYCSGEHHKIHFDGTEVASTASYEERADVLEGPTLDLKDDGRCGFARFCHREDGDAWTLTRLSDDPVLREQAVLASKDCPSGRLVHYDKTDNYRPMEDAHSPFVSLLQDPGQCCSSGVYVRGGIPLESAESAEGRTYETRQRYTLCRCGLSQNKPFCDASHVSARWIDGLTEESKD